MVQYRSTYAGETRITHYNSNQGTQQENGYMQLRSSCN